MQPAPAAVTNAMLVYGNLTWIGFGIDRWLARHSDALRAAMLEVLERVERLLDDGMARLTPQLRDQRDAAAVMFVCGVVEASGPRRSGSMVHM